jgi:hypothetical protein
MDTPFWSVLFRIGRFIWPIVSTVLVLGILWFAWRLHPLAFGIIAIGLIYFIQRFRWASHDAMG